LNSLLFLDRKKIASAGINYLIILFAFVVPISRAGISILSVLMILLWLIEGDFKRKINQLKDNSIIIALGLFIVFCYISISWTDVNNIKDGLDDATKTLRLILLPLLVISTSLKAENISKVITAFLLGMLISEILSYGIFFELWILPYGVGVPHDPTPFMHHLDYATFLTFTSLLLLNRFFATNNIGLKTFYFIYFLFVTSNLFLNGGRTGHFAFAVSIFAVGFLNIKSKIKAFFSMLLLVVAIFYTAYHVSPVFKTRFDQGAKEISHIKADSTSQYQGSFGMRLGSWIVSVDIIKDNFLFGVGAGSEGDSIRDYSLRNEDKSLHVVHDVGNFHNQFVEIFVKLGMVGLIFYIMIWYSIAKINIKSTNLSNLRYIFIAVFSSASMVENIFENQFPMALFVLFIGIFIVASRDKLHI